MVAQKDPGVHFVGKPTFLVLPKAKGQISFLQFGFRQPDGQTGKIFPVFTGPEPATLFRDALGEQGQGMELESPPSFDDLLEVLERLKKGGTTHVQFNRNPGPDPAKSPEPVPIDKVIESLRNRPK